jgi:mannose-1-phosphate guanylyltransferase
MRALLLAAGLGTRLQPITETIPKCLVPINGRPLLDYWLELLANGGVESALVNLHYLPDPVVEFLSKSLHKIKITTAYEESLLGTAGTVLKNKDFFGQGSIMLIHADNLSLFDVNEFVNKFNNRDHGIEITMMTFHTDAPESCGILEVNEIGVVCKVHEKVKNAPGNLANAAVYIISPAVVDFITNIDKEFIDFTLDILPKYVGRINTYHNNIYHRDIGSLESLAKAEIEYTKAINSSKFNFD